MVSSVVYQTVVDKMPGYSWHITEGPQSQEIMVGVKKNMTAFFTQKTGFQSGQSTLRPGALLTVKVGEKHYPLLFLHLKSLTVPRGFGLRDDQTERAIKFRKTLDKAAKGKANYIFLGDLNTMGMNLTYSPKDVSGAEEIERLRKRAAKRDMVILDKRGPSWWPGSKSSYSPSNLDHVVAADHLNFKLFGGKPVDLRGWPEETADAKKDKWVERFSDHALLYFEVQK